MRLTVIIGGKRSGKTELAQSLVKGKSPAWIRERDEFRTHKITKETQTVVVDDSTNIRWVLSVLKKGWAQVNPKHGPPFILSDFHFIVVSSTYTPDMFRKVTCNKTIIEL